MQVALPGPCSLLSSGYFHCIAGLAAGGLVVWGSNLQVLRLEAQRRKKERQAARKAEERRQEEEEVERGLREAAEDDGSCIAVEEELHSSSFPSISQPLVDPASEAHLVAQVVAVPSEVGPVASVACGSQHSVILSRAGRLYAFEHSLEGQLGVGSRTSTKTPTLVTAGAEDVAAVEDGARQPGHGVGLRLQRPLPPPPGWSPWSPAARNRRRRGEGGCTCRRTTG